MSSRSQVPSNACWKFQRQTTRPCESQSTIPVSTTTISISHSFFYHFFLLHKKVVFGGNERRKKILSRQGQKKNTRIKLGKIVAVAGSLLLYLRNFTIVWRDRRSSLFHIFNGPTTTPCSLRQTQ